MVFTKASLALAAAVTADVTTNGWPGNSNAPHCGCQIIADNADFGQGPINSTCEVSFGFGSGVPHFVSVASSFMVGRDGGTFKFTGYDEVTNPEKMDILVFYEDADCQDGVDDDGNPFYQWNMTGTELQGLGDVCDYTLTCTPTADGNALPGVRLGNFAYDIARSVQTYTVPVWGLAQGETVTFPITDYDGNPNNCMNPLAHHGHGDAIGCSTNSTTGCNNELVFTQNPDHQGLLEYFSFEPVSPVNNPICYSLPIHHDDDYQWEVPSPWDTQQAYEDSL